MIIRYHGSFKKRLAGAHDSVLVNQNRKSCCAFVHYKSFVYSVVIPVLNHPPTEWQNGSLFKQNSLILNVNKM